MYKHTLGLPHSDTTPGFISLKPHSEHTVSSELFMCKYPAQEFRKSKQLEHCNLWVCLESSLRVANPSQEGVNCFSECGRIAVGSQGALQSLEGSLIGLRNDLERGSQVYRSWPGVGRWLAQGQWLG